jgi:hypothetical protein
MIACSDATLWAVIEGGEIRMQMPAGESDDLQLRGIDSRHKDPLARVFQATRPQLNF